MSQTALKLCALLLMTLDHIGALIPGAPVWFRFLGRMAAPIFIFCLIVSYEKTSNPQRLLKRLYFFGIGMAAGNLAASRLLELQTPLQYNFFVTLFCILLLLEVCFSGHARRPWLFALYAALSLVGVVAAALNEELHWLDAEWIGLLTALTANPFLTEGGLSAILLALCLYWGRNSAGKLAALYVGWHLVTLCLSVYPALFRLCALLGRYGEGCAYVLQRMGLPAPFAGHSPFSLAGCQWMGVFALPLLLCYRGQRGRGWKGLFYGYYPVHLWLLAALGAAYAA